MHNLAFNCPYIELEYVRQNEKGQENTDDQMTQKLLCNFQGKW